MEKLSIIIPVYNEEKTVLKVIQGVKKVRIKGAEKEIIVVDDCSTDSTRDILKKINDKSIKILYHKKNSGKGAAIRTALEHCKGSIISIQDADSEYDPRNILGLIRPILNKQYDVVYGSRFLGRKMILFGRNKTVLPMHWIGNRCLTFLTNLLYFNGITDMETGCKVFKKEVVEGIKLKSKRFDFEPEITAKILKRGYKIKELPIHFNPRTHSEGKKITWKDGIKAAYYLFKYRLVN